MSTQAVKDEKIRVATETVRTLKAREDRLAARIARLAEQVQALEEEQVVVTGDRVAAEQRLDWLVKMPVTPERITRTTGRVVALNTNADLGTEVARADAGKVAKG